MFYKGDRKSTTSTINIGTQNLPIHRSQHPSYHERMASPARRVNGTVMQTHGARILVLLLGCPAPLCQTDLQHCTNINQFDQRHCCQIVTSMNQPAPSPPVGSFRLHRRFRCARTLLVISSRTTTSKVDVDNGVLNIWFGSGTAPRCGSSRGLQWHLPAGLTRFS